jgi:DASH complex subunit Duo1
MAKQGGGPATENVHLSDDSDIDEDLWGSPSKAKPHTPHTNTQSRQKETSYEKQNAREEALRRELESVRRVNEAIEGAIESLAKAKNSMKVCQQDHQSMINTICQTCI